MLLQRSRQAWSAPGQQYGHPGSNYKDATGSNSKEYNCQRVAINYEKLRHFCYTFASGSGSHQFAMSEYPSLFIKMDKKKKVDCPAQHRPHTCHALQSSSDSSPSHDIRFHMSAIRRETKEEDVVLIAARVKVILSIIKKPPVMRSDREVKQLADHLEFFSSLFPIPDENISVTEFYMGLAQRATLEKLPGEGYAIAGRNGLHFILQGKVEKRSRAEDTKFAVTSRMLHPGNSFGNIAESTGDGTQLAWPTYPYYSTKSPCCLLNITSTDYHRVVQICRKKFFEERQALVKQCPLFHGVSSLVTSQLTKSIAWEAIATGTVVVREGEVIERVMFIKEGQCSAIARVPTRTRTLRLTVGTLGPRDCIGEALIWNGTERHPYTIVSSTDLVLGVISCTSFEPNEIRKHISIHGRLSLPLLTEKQLRARHVRHLMDRQWHRVKDHVVAEIVTERGIEFDTKKWRHILSQ